jgi:hypothetical protein
MRCQVIQLPYSLSHPLHYLTLRSEVNVSLAHLIRRVRRAIVITWGPSSVVCRPSVRKHFNPFLENHCSKWDQTRQECSLHGQTKGCYFRYDRLSNMAARGHTSLWLAEIFNDLLLRYYMEDGIENCHEWSLQAANQVLLLIGPMENPRWPPTGDIISHSDPMGNM